ncbi:MAG: hypothetical protein HY720_32330 [Planctomycetes bacterium]|nr:hypothetical protein [Planctomycetota bacterium]
MTFNPAQSMTDVVQRNLSRGIRVFTLESDNELRRSTRRRLEPEMVEEVHRIATAIAGPFLCHIPLDENRHRLLEPILIYGGPR